MKRNLISIIILNWNGKEFLKECISALKQTRYKPVEIIVVDNASTDDSREYIATLDEVLLVTNDYNTGYAAGNNKGIEFSKGEYIATLNNDCIVEPDWLDKCIEFFESDSRIGAISCRQMNYRQREMIDSLYHYPTAQLAFDRIGYNKKYSAESTDTRPGYVIGPNGGSAIYRRTMLSELGGFDERLYAYQDETDLAMRAFLKGWKCIYNPHSCVYHMGGASFSKRVAARYFYSERNRYWFIYKYFPWRWIIRSCPYLLITEIKNAIKVIFQEHLLHVYIKARIKAFSGLAGLHEERKYNVRDFIKRIDSFKQFVRYKIIPYNKES